MNGGSRDLRRYMVVLGLSTTYGIKAKDKIDEPELMKRTKAPISSFFWARTRVRTVHFYITALRAAKNYILKTGFYLILIIIII